MKIYFFMHTVFGPGGGVLTVVRHLAEDLAKQHEVEIVSVVRPRREPVHPLPDNVKVRSLVDTGPLASDPDVQRPSKLMPEDEPHYPAYSLATDRALEQFLPSVRDGVLLGMQPGVNLAIAKLADPSVVRVGQMHRPFEPQRKQLRKAEKKYFPRLDAFLTLTEGDAAKYREFLDRSLRIEVIPNATPAYGGERSTLENKVVTAAGHLRPNKGFDRLVDAWAIVAEQHPDWELRIFGNGPLQEELQKQIDDLGLEGKVRLMGYSTALREEMAKSSLFAMTSHKEAYGMVLVEAMSCGVPVVSFDSPNGPASIINEGVDGFLVRNGDIGGLAERISRVIEMGASGRKALGDAGLRNAAGRTQPVVTGRWVSLLEELQREKSRR
ncbi:MAG TPA: glycosyltransferase family 4 protein [Nocardioidaceae bacterium]|nr:glycosyltransferase family 4 protein [Nocardioidaceae bacterium]